MLNLYEEAIGVTRVGQLRKAHGLGYDGLRKTQKDIVFSDWLSFTHVFNIGLSYCILRTELRRSEQALIDRFLWLLPSECTRR